MLCAGPAPAAPPDVLTSAGHAAVTAVLDGDTVRIEGQDADVRLVGLRAPRRAPARGELASAALAEDATRALSELVAGHAVTVRLADSPRDRNGRLLAHLVRDDGLWIQIELLRSGWARVDTTLDNRRFAAEMLAAESEARGARRGIWASRQYAVRDAASRALFSDKGTFQIVAGQVTAAVRTKDRIYINFGDDYRDDFTATIEKPDWKLFGDLDPAGLKARMVEVRGWVVIRNGPMIELTHPEQLIVK